MQDIELTSTCVQTGWQWVVCLLGCVYAWIFFTSQMPVKFLTEDINLLVSWSVKKLVQL